MLVDTGAAVSIVSDTYKVKQKIWPVKRWGELAAFTGNKCLVPFTKDLKCQIGVINVVASFGLLPLDDEIGIIGMDILGKLGAVVDFANAQLWEQEEEGALPVSVPASHRVAAIKAPDDLQIPNWEPAVKQVTEKHLAVFATNKAQCGKTHTEVQIKGPDPRPQRQYKYPIQAEESLQKTITALMDQGVLVETQSPCNAPIWPVKKADGTTWRLTVDYRELNRVTPRMAPIVAKYPEVMAKIAGGAKWFSVLDLSNAFFSIPVKKESWYKLAFTFNNRQLTFSRLPQGYHNSPSICHQEVAKIWKESPHQDKVISYVDDILLAAETKEQNLNILGHVLEKIKEAGFLINPVKAQLCKQEVVYLGVTLGTEGRSPNQQRIDLICKLPAPQDLNALRSFLGLTGFSREFIERYAALAKPLYKLLKKGEEWQWGSEQQEAFVALKTALMKAPALAYPQEDKPYLLQLAATKTDISAILSQNHGTGEKIIAYGSKSLSEVEKQFTSCEKEVLALVWALNHWEYLIGLSPVMLRTKHTPTKYVLTGKINQGRISNPRLAGWTLALVNRDIHTEQPTQNGLAPYALTIKGQDHECPLPEEPICEIKSPFTVVKEKDAPLENVIVWATDGSSYYKDGKPVAGYAAAKMGSEDCIQGIVRPASAQAAEVIAIAAVLEQTDKDFPVIIITDSGWTLQALIDWMPVWLQRNMRTGDGKLVAHHQHLKYAWDLAIQRQAKTWLCKVKAHTKSKTPFSSLNEKADKLAKEAALLGNEHLWKRKIPINPVKTRNQCKSDIDLPDILTLQEKDPQVQELLQKQSCKEWTIYTSPEGLIMAKSSNQEIPVVVLPQCLRKELVQLAHNQGHFGPDKVLARVREIAWWPGMTKDIQQVSDNCLQCVVNNPDPKVLKGPLKHQPIVGPWHRIQIDYIGPLPTTGRGMKYALVVIDSFSKWIEVYPTRNNTAITTAKKLLNEAFSRYGLPHQIDSDQGPHFIRETIKHLSAALGINWKLHIAGHPQSSGLVERTNRTLKASLRKVVCNSGKNWDVQLPLILMAFRSTVGAHGFTPHEVFTGRKMRTPELWWVQGGVPPDEFQPHIKMSDWVQKVLNRIYEVQQRVAHQLGKNIQAMNGRLGSKLKCIEWQVGDRVVYRWFSELGHGLSPRWVGPVKIINKASPTVYQLRITDHKGRLWDKWFHSSQLKEWKGNIEDKTEGEK
ncbi:protein NYNRIN-like [Emydura macquarii macquarii]|uniref:protein NYNRIN-like n=1 Tax=Emydura macquarii macquarii TaxID=1129001 RepID=UPI00352A273C